MPQCSQCEKPARDVCAYCEQPLCGEHIKTARVGFENDYLELGLCGLCWLLTWASARLPR
jgi:hypothetical protein